MIRIISALFLAAAALLCSAAEQPLQLADNAPARHVVVQGDTLWGISAKFLKEPWRWPEIWGMNKSQIKNPNLIYPGDIIVLERDANGNPILRVGGKATSGEAKLEPQVYATLNQQSIPPIPPNVIEPFISAPLVVEIDALNNAPRIVATQQDRVFLGNGSLAYVTNADPKQLMWQVYRNGQPMLDPENENSILGYEAFYLGTANQTKPGEPATFEILTAKQEIGRDDRLVPAVSPQLVAYVPHKPDRLIQGRVITVYGGVDTAGRGAIISINRGTKDGLEIGHVLALERNRTFVPRDGEDRNKTVVIPTERTGLIFIFRVFDRISYALIVQSEGAVETNDFVKTP